MPWRKLTEDDLVAALSRDEVEAYRRDFETDPVPELLRQAAETVRGYVRSNGSVRMDPTPETLPASLVGPAIDYAVVSVLKRIAIDPNETRTQARADALELFRDIAAGRHRPEDYDQPPDDAHRILSSAPATGRPNPEKRLLD